jgi:hypothetical protein
MAIVTLVITILLGALLVPAAVSAQQPAPQKGDVARLDPRRAVALPGVETVRVVATAGDHILIKQGAFAVNNEPVQGLSRTFLTMLPVRPIDRIVPVDHALVVFDGRGPGGPIRYWAVMRVSALVSADSP